MRNLFRGTRHIHGGIFEKDEAQVGQTSYLNRCVKLRTAFGLGVMLDNVFSCHFMPVVETMARVNIFGREKRLHKLSPAFGIDHPKTKTIREKLERLRTSAARAAERLPDAQRGN